SIARVLILAGSTGGGHFAVARALAEGLCQVGGSTAEVEVLDVYDPTCSALPLGAFPRLYHLLSARLPAWCLRGVVALMDTRAGFGAVETLVQPCCQPGLQRQMHARRPDIVVPVLPGWAASARRALDRAGNAAPVVTVVTDL